MTTGLQTALIRLHHRDAHRPPQGTGFAISPTQALTCAHVVAHACNVDLATLQANFASDDDDPITVTLDFPYLASGNLSARLTHLNVTQDIALLTSDQPWPEAVQPVTLVIPGEGHTLDHHPFRAYGFPEGHEERGQWADGRIVATLPDGWLQIEGETVTGYQIAPGYSGSPVWNERVAGVVGLVAQAEIREARKAAFALSSEQLVTSLPSLPHTTLDSPQALAHRRYHHRVVDKRTSEQLDLQQKFIRLTLIIDHGLDAPQRYEPSGRTAEQYEDLAELLRQRDDQALVLLGPPGCGKTVLLQRLELEHAVAELAERMGRYPYFIRLQQYRLDAPDPFTWLEARWSQQAHLPPFDELLRDGRFLFLFDGLNEMPHGDNYAARVSHWSDFLDTHLAGSGCRALFTCRTLDYSAPLGEGCAITVQQVQVDTLNRAKIEAFIRAYVPEEDVADKIWGQIKSNDTLLDLFAIPFFLKLLVELETVRRTGDIPRDRADLITQFVRQALARELREKASPLLKKAGLLHPAEVKQIGRGNWGRSPYALPERGPLIPALTQLAHRMQAGRTEQERGLVSLPLGEVEDVLTAFLPADLDPYEAVQVGAQLNLLDEEEGQTEPEIRFHHQLLQEYFAARQVTMADLSRVRVPHLVAEITPSLEDELAQLQKNQPLSPLPSTGWEETMVLAAEMSDNPAAFVRALQGLNLPLAAQLEGIFGRGDFFRRIRCFRTGVD